MRAKYCRNRTLYIVEMLMQKGASKAIVKREEQQESNVTMLFSYIRNATRDFFTMEISLNNAFFSIFPNLFSLSIYDEEKMIKIAARGARRVNSRAVCFLKKKKKYLHFFSAFLFLNKSKRRACPSSCCSDLFRISFQRHFLSSLKFLIVSDR